MPIIVKAFIFLPFGIGVSAGACDLDGIEATLRRYGYDIKALSEPVDAHPSEIRTYFKGRLSSGRATEIQKEILKLGIVGL